MDEKDLGRVPLESLYQFMSGILELIYWIFCMLLYLFLQTLHKRNYFCFEIKGPILHVLTKGPLKYLAKMQKKRIVRAVFTNGIRVGRPLFLRIFPHTRCREENLISLHRKYVLTCLFDLFIFLNCVLFSLIWCHQLVCLLLREQPRSS